MSHGQKAGIPRLYDITHPQPEETRTAEEIIGGIKGKIERLVD